MSEIEAWPKPRKPRRGMDRPYRVDYDLAYDGGGSCWSGYYRTVMGARLASWWNRHVSSWGGSAVLRHNSPGGSE